MKIDPVDLAQYKCTCDMSDSLGDHPQSCDLWLSSAYAQGAADWDPSTKALLPWDLDDWDESEWEAFLAEASLEAGEVPGLTEPTATPASTAAVWGWSGAATVQKCRHYQQPFTLPDGTVVHASSHHRHEPDKGDKVPDLGVYLDGIWEPVCVAFLVGCPDYGTPTPSVANVLHMAREALRVAREGGMVEIGCIGGHGRTGMFLAILTVLTMEQPDGKAAVEMVRKTYCNRAVESENQEWYVEGIACEVTGKPWPPKPVPKPIVYTSAYTPQPGKSNPTTPAKPTTVTVKGGTGKKKPSTSKVVGAIEKLTATKKK